MSKQRVQRSYTPEQRRQALERAEAVGCKAAGEELGIPSSTISYWRGLERRRAVSRQEAAAEPKAGQESEASRQSQSEAAPAPAPQAEKRKKSGGRRVARIYTPSERARALELAEEKGVTEAARELGISRFSIYDWQRKAKLHAEGEAEDSPVVGSDEDPRAERDRRILEVWRANPGLGPSQVRNQLRRQGLKVSVHTVRCVMEEHGYVTPKVRRDPVHDRRYEAVRPNHLWHMDFLHRHVHKLKVHVLLVVDDFSRFIVGGALWDGERVAAVCETFQGAVARHGKPEKVMSDGGSAFYAWRGVSAFTRLLEELEVDQLIASVPQSNGKLEVLNANIQKELFNPETFFDLGEAQRRFAAWVQFYNFRRTHHALGGLLVPADRYFGRAQEVLAAIESGHSPDGLGEPLAVEQRELDLLRLSSCRGRLELSLLGHRIPLPVPPVAGG